MKQKKHIAFFISSLNIGGVEKVFVTYANKLQDKGYQLDFIVCKNQGDLLNTLSPEINLINLGDIKLRNSILKLRKYIKARNPDILISGPDFPNFVNILSSLFIKKKPRIIITQHNYINIETSKLGLHGKLLPFFIKILYPYADKIITVSKDISEFLMKDFKIQPAKLTHISNPILCEDIEKFSKEPLTFNLPTNYIVFVGRLSIVKNIPMLLEAFKLLENDNLELVFVGEGIEEKNLKTIVHDLKIKNVYFLGPTNNPYNIINNAQLVVLPSWSESFSVVLIESLVLKKTIVSTPTKGAMNVLNNGEFGYISNSFEYKEFSELIKYALKNPLNEDKLYKRGKMYDIKI